MSFFQIPPELWNEIFLHTLPPPDFFDESASSCVDSIWHQMIHQKKALLLVCRSWYEVGLPFLYEDISISRPHQLPLLCETLKQSQSGIQHSVRRLRISVLIPDRFVDTFNHYLQQTLQLCDSLVSLNFVSYDASYSWEITSPSLNMPPSITRLTFTRPVVEKNMGMITHNILEELVSTLTHLDIYDFLPQSPLIFPSLTDLTLKCAPHMTDSTFSLSGKYEFPAIQKATFCLVSWPGGVVSVLGFCRRYGHQLRMLQMQEPRGMKGNIGLVRNGRREGGSIALQPVLDECPMLEHLVLHPDVMIPIQHPHVQWVDIWEPSMTLSESESLLKNSVDLKKSITTNNFPKLTNIRTLGHALQTLHPSIPVLFPPSIDCDPAFKPCDFQFNSSLHIRHERGRIFSPPLHSFFGPEDDDSDGTYEEDSDQESESENDLTDDSEPDENESEGKEDRGPKDCDLLIERFGIPVLFPPSLDCEPGFKPYDFHFNSNLHVRHERGRIFSPPLQSFFGPEDDDSDGTYEEDSDQESESENDLTDDSKPDENESEGEDSDRGPKDCDLLIERFGRLNTQP